MQSTHFELVEKPQMTAKRLVLTVPANVLVLALADDVVE
jgi:hypothetical protein